MSEDVPNLKATAMQIAATLAKDVYTDGLQPPVKAIGEALAGIVKAVAYYPRYWAIASDISIEQKVEGFQKKLKQRLDEIPDERKVLPKPSIVGPAIQALEYAVLEDELADMFANLLASASDSETQDATHPAFVEIIKQLNPNEAKILSFFSGLNNQYAIVDVKDYNNHSAYIVRNFMLQMQDVLSNPEDSQVSIENLQRLKLIDIEHNQYIWSIGDWSDIYDKWFEKYCLGMEKRGFPSDGYNMEKKVLFVSEFGRQFVQVCVTNPDTASKETHHD
jgi:Abortive infection alpha